MNRKLLTVGSILLFVAGLVLAPSLLASAAPPTATAGTPASKTSGPVIANKERHPVQAELVRELIRLERTKHVMELASAKNPSPHRKAAVDHMQSAINEIEAELKENSKTPGGAK